MSYAILILGLIIMLTMGIGLGIVITLKGRSLMGSGDIAIAADSVITKLRQELASLKEENAGLQRALNASSVGRITKLEAALSQLIMKHPNGHWYSVPARMADEEGATLSASGDVVKGK